MVIFLHLLVTNLVLIYFYSETPPVKPQKAANILILNFVFGMIMVLASPQPLTIIGLSGPVYVYESMVKKAIYKMELEYYLYGFRLLVSIFTFLILFFASFLDWKKITHAIGHFTVEIFEVENGLMFIILSIKAFQSLEYDDDIKMKTAIPVIILVSTSQVNCDGSLLQLNSFFLNSSQVIGAF